MLRFKGVGASTGRSAICDSKLQRYGKQMRDIVQHRQLSNEYLLLGERYTELTDKEAESTWLAT